MNVKTIYEIDDSLSFEIYKNTNEAFIRLGKTEICLGYLDCPDAEYSAQTLANSILDALEAIKCSRPK